MSFSKKLDSKRDSLKALVKELKKDFKYVSILGTDVLSKNIRADRKSQVISDGMDKDFGFVVKMSNGGSYLEYSLDDVSGDVKEIAKTIKESVKVSEVSQKRMIKSTIREDEPHVESFFRASDLENYTDSEILEYCVKTKDMVISRSEKILNAICIFQTANISKIFVTENKMLDQNYCYVLGVIYVIYRDNDRVVSAREGAGSVDVKDVMIELPKKIDHLLHIADRLTYAKNVVPGYYDVITDPTITGLIAHEAFGHGVEMDQFVKDRALAKNCINQYVASPICNMKDGAPAALNIASYFFDDDGIIAKTTQIIRDGILINGMSDMVSADELGTIPTGNGRRESHNRKAYTRMTNTFFEPGTSNKDEMIKSIKHGYLLVQTNNGMEDPKNWAIQCACEYGIEIVDGKLTDNLVSPVVMSGYVPDLLKSISAVSDDFEVEGAGFCGKGYKEWVRVSDGGPFLKAKVKLG